MIYSRNFDTFLSKRMFKNSEDKGPVQIFKTLQLYKNLKKNAQLW